MSTSLFKLLSVLNSGQDAVTAEIDFDEIVKDLAGHVDSYHTIEKRLKLEEAWLDSEIKELTKKRKTLRNNIRNFKARIKDAMLYHEFTKVPGDRWKLQLIKKKAVQILNFADEQLWKEYPDLISRRVSYTWDKKKIKEEFSEGRQISHVPVVTGWDARFYRQTKKKGKK